MSQKQIQKIINRLQGTFTLSEIIGDKWNAQGSKNSLGREFKEMVVRGQLENITYFGTTKTNHAIYIIS